MCWPIILHLLKRLQQLEPLCGPCKLRNTALLLSALVIGVAFSSGQSFAALRPSRALCTNLA